MVLATPTTQHGSASKKALASATWQKEIQRAIAVSAWDQITGKDTMPATQLQLKLFKLYHGDDDDPHSIALTSQCLGGVNQFAHLWERVELENNAAGNEQRSDGVNLVLKSGTLRSSSVRFVAGTAFTMTSISASSQQDNACALDGRAIFSAKELVLKSLKKALAFAKMYCEKGDAFPKLPSGKTEEDFDLFILKKMYLAENKKEYLVDPTSAVESSPASASVSNVESSPDDASTNDVINVADAYGSAFSAQEEDALAGMTADYIFPGWVAFKCFGPMAPECYRLTVLETGGLSKEKTKAGSRTNTRKEAALDKDYERDNGKSGSPYKRGIRTGATKKDVASIALAADASDQRAREGEMLALTQSLASKNKRCDLLLRLANLHPEGSINRKNKMDEVEEVLDDITHLETKMETYSQTAKRPRLAAVDSLLAVTMNTPLAKEEQPPSASSEVAATIESGPCHFLGCETTSGHICQGSCGFYVCITCCDEMLQLQPGAYYCNDCFNELSPNEQVVYRN
jgi:hypothetical protein